MDNELFELCKEVYKRFPDWDNKSSTPYNERLKVWRRGFSISEMGEGNDAYETTPPNERNKVNVDDWEIKEDARHQLTTGQEVFKWWYSEVKMLENNIVPLYTSDYLLEKLPLYIQDEPRDELSLLKSDINWGAGYFRAMDSDEGIQYLAPIMANGDTPLKALLKLVIVLDDAGVKL